MADNTEIKGLTFTTRTLDEWKHKWVKGEDRLIRFHEDHINPILRDYVSHLIDGRECISIFVPLCGKTLGMKWLYDKGHTVVGVEISEIAIQEFFEESGLEYTSSPISSMDGIQYKSLDGRVRLYSCDIFKFSKEIDGPFDGIWDRGSLVAINRDDRQRYAKLMMNLMHSKFRYLLNTMDYDIKQYKGPPHHVSDDDLSGIYGGYCNVDKIAYLTDVPEDRGKAEELGVDYYHQVAHLITLK